MSDRDKTARTAPKLAKRQCFSSNQFKVVIKGMNGEPTLPTAEEFAGLEEP